MLKKGKNLKQGTEECRTLLNAYEVVYEENRGDALTIYSYFYKKLTELGNQVLNQLDEEFELYEEVKGDLKGFQELFEKTVRYEDGKNFLKFLSAIIFSNNDLNNFLRGIEGLDVVL